MQYLIGAIIAVYIALLILGKKKRVTADYILASWALFSAVHLTYVYYYASGKYIDAPELIGWNAPIPLGHGPFFYTYILHLTQQQRSKYGWLLFFIPLFLGYLYILPKLLHLPDAARISMLRDDQQPELRCEYLFPELTIGIICSGVIYIAASLVLLRRHKKNINEQFSNTDRIRLNWVKYLIAGIGIILTFFLLRQAELTYLSVVSFIIFLGYFGIRKVGIISDAGLHPDVNVEGNKHSIADAKKTTAKVKYENSALTEEMAKKIYHELISVMQTESIYKDAELTLSALAKRLSVHPGILSEVINKLAQKSFYDYVNEYRVNEFKKLVQLPENRNFTILSIAFDCGFNSKSSFNRNFKKITHVSPSAYVKQHMLQVIEK